MKRIKEKFLNALFKFSLDCVVSIIEIITKTRAHHDDIVNIMMSTQLLFDDIEYFGFYSLESRNIILNKNISTFQQGQIFVHEATHLVQHLDDRFGEYITADKDYEGYLNQPTEREAVKASKYGALFGYVIVALIKRNLGI